MVKMPEPLREDGNNFLMIIKWSAISICITIIFLLIYALLLTFTSISENTIPTVITLITMLSVLIGTSICMTKVKNNGIINGFLIGLIYTGTIYILSSIITKNFILNIKSIIMLIGAIVCGAVGGIIGVNRK